MWLVFCRTMWLLSLTQIQENGHQTRSASTQCSMLPGRGAQNIVCLIVYTVLYIYLTMWYMDIMWCGDILFCMGTVVLYMTMSPSFLCKDTVWYVSVTMLYVGIVWWLYTMWPCLRDHNIVRGHCLVSETRPCVFLTHRLSLKETLRFFWAVFLAFTSGEEVSELRFSVIKFFSPLKYQYLSTIGEVFLGKMQENQRVEKGLTAE